MISLKLIEQDFLDFLSETNQDDIRYPQPVEDFLNFLSEIEFQKIPKINSINKNEFQKLADEIEEQLQNKNKTPKIIGIVLIITIFS